MTAQPIRAIDLDAGIIEGLAIPFGGPMDGKDLYGTTFTADTDFHLDWFPAGRPVLYGHGLEEGTRAMPIGRQFEQEKRDEGMWMRAQLDTSNRYFALIRSLIEKGVLYFSTGSMEHLKQINAEGVITDWPWIETSLTPKPVNPYAVLDATRAIDDYKAVGLYFPDAAREPQATWTTTSNTTNGTLSVPWTSITLDGTDLDAAAVEAARKALESETTAPDPIEGLWLAWIEELSRRV